MRKSATTRRWLFPRVVGIVVGLWMLGSVFGCGETEEATDHEIPVVTDGAHLEGVETNEDYEVNLQSVQLRVQHVEFTVGGEAHDESELSWRRSLRRVLVPEAVAHPNHSAGGEVAGTVEGPRVLTWRPGEVLETTTGTFFEGDYRGYDVTFSGEQTEGDELEAGLMALLEGNATGPEGTVVEFRARFEHFDTAGIIGGALSATVPDDEMEAIALTLRPYDEYGDQSMFDDIDFDELDDGTETTVEIEPHESAHTRMRNALMSHEFYGGRVVRD